MNKKIVSQFDRAVDTNNRRAVKNDAIGSLTLEQFETAYLYFGGKCAYSGQDFKNKSQISIEHIIPVVSGGHSMAFNCIPVVNKYNSSKSGYHLLDWWKSQNDGAGRSIYNPYKLLKLINYMVKCLEAMELEEQSTYVLTDNDTDIFLNENKNLLNSNIVDAVGKSDYKKISQFEVFRRTDILRIEDLYSIYEGLDKLKINVAIFLEEAIYELRSAIPDEILNGIVNRIRSLPNIYVDDKKVFKKEMDPKDVEIRKSVLDWATREGLENKYGITGYMNFEVLKTHGDISTFLDSRKEDVTRLIGANIEDFNALINKIPNILTSLDVGKRIGELERVFGINCETRDGKSSEMFRYAVNKPDLLLSGENMDVLIKYSEIIPVDKRLFKKGIPITTILDNIEVSIEMLEKANFEIDEKIKKRILMKIVNNSDGKLIRLAFKDFKRRVETENEEYSHDEVERDAARWIICISEKYNISEVFKDKRVGKTRPLYKGMEFNEEGYMKGVNPNAYIVPNIVRLANLNISRDAESELVDNIFASKRIHYGERADKVVRLLAKYVLEDNPDIDEEHTVQEASRWFVFLSELSEISLDDIFSAKKNRRYIEATRQKYKSMKFDEKGNFINFNIGDIEIGSDFVKLSDSYLHAKGDFYLIKGEKVPKSLIKEELEKRLAGCKNKKQVKNVCIQILKKLSNREEDPIGGEDR